MSKLPKLPQNVTDLELAILQRIWEAGVPQSVSQIVAAWHEAQKPGYTTILKTLQKMEAKGVVRHHQDGRRYAYESLVERDEVADRRLETIIDRMFSGNRVSFAQYFIESSELSADELRDLKRLVDRRQKEDSR